MEINKDWLAEFVAAFEQHIEGEDGDYVGRDIWTKSDAAWKDKRNANPGLGFSDALEEVDAWMDES